MTQTQAAHTAAEESQNKWNKPIKNIFDRLVSFVLTFFWILANLFDRLVSFVLTFFWILVNLEKLGLPGEYISHEFWQTRRAMNIAERARWCAQEVPLILSGSDQATEDVEKQKRVAGQFADKYKKDANCRLTIWTSKQERLLYLSQFRYFLQLKNNKRLYVSLYYSKSQCIITVAVWSLYRRRQSCCPGEISIFDRLKSF